ncbi:hypothetical protein BDQ17DRAFT_1337166, partial [Cyathus striatus]
MASSEKSTVQIEVERKNSHSTQKELEETTLQKPLPPSFPDGGREAWTVVAGAWLAIFVSFGFLNAFGGGLFEISSSASIQLEHLQLISHGSERSKPFGIQSRSSITFSKLIPSNMNSMYFMGSVFGSLFDRYGAK